MSYRLLESYSRQTLFPFAAGVLTLVLACTHNASAQGDLQLPDSPGSIGVSEGSASRTVSPQSPYSSNGYAASAGGAYSSAGVAYSELLGSHLRARYNTQSYGQRRGNLDLGTMMLYDQGDSAWFLDGQVTLNDDSQVGYNFGVGYRFLTLPLLPGKPGSQKLAGISLWSDGQSTINDNFISQIGVSLEYLGDNWDLRSNVYVPFADTEVGEFRTNGTVSYLETFLVQETIAGADEALTVAEIEAARRIGDLEAWGFVGGYSLNGDSTDTAGYKIGLRGYATPDISVQFAITDDDVFGTNAVFTGTWFIGRTRTNTPCRSQVAMRMREPVLRNDYVAIRQQTVTSGIALSGDVDGDGDDERIQIVHVDSTAPDGGDGTFENPLNALSDVEANSPTDAIVLVHGGSTFTNDAAVLQDGQRLLGEGASIDHVVDTTRFGDVSLPETAAGAQAGAIPTITNAAGDAITLANDTQEVSNLSITGGDRGVVSPSGVAAVNLNNLTIASTTGNGVELTPGVLDLDGDDVVDDDIFAPTITDVTFSNVGGDDINLDGQSTTVTFGATIADVTSTGGSGTGIVIANTTAATTITDYSHDGGDASTGGILINGATGQVAVTTATIANEGGFGIRINDSDAGHIFTDVDITDTGDTAFDVIGGPTTVATTTTFTGTITQSEDALAVSVSGDHAGTINFSESTTDAGVVNATNGGGILFDEAEGSYNFNSAVVLDGAANGAATRLVIDDSDDDGESADISFADATIVSPTGDAVELTGVNSTASVNFTGEITQANAFSVVSVTDTGADGHEGTLLFNAATAGGDLITATDGDGFQFNNANGGYTFNDVVTLNGGDAGIDIDDSDGNFFFANTSIENPTGEGIDINGGEAVVTYTGSITQFNNAAAVQVVNHGTATGTPVTSRTGSLILNATAADENLINATAGPGLVFNTADGTYDFNGEVTLNGFANVADTGIDIIASDGDFTFTDATITDPTGDAIQVDGGQADVTFAGLITQNNNAAAAVSVTGEHTGTLIFNEETTDEGVVNATIGTGLQFDNADGNYFFNNAVTLNGGDAGIDIINDSDGTFTFSDATITDPTGVAFNVESGDAAATFTGLITQTNNVAAVSVSGGHTGTLNFNEDEVDAGVVVATNGTGLQFNNADGAYNFNDAVTLNGGDAGVDITNDSDGEFNFDADSAITNPTGEAFVVSGSAATVTYDGTIVDNSGNAVLLSANDGGMVTFGGTIDSPNAGGVDVVNNTGGTFNFDGAVDLDTAGNDAVTITGNSDTTVAFNAGDVDTTIGDGFLITGNTDGAVTIDDITISTTTGDAIEADGNSGTAITINGVDADTTTGAALTMDGNTGGSVSLVGSTFESTAGGQGVAINNTEGLDGAANSVTTTTGTGLSITSSTVDNSGLAFDSVTVDGAANGIVLQTITDGEVSVGVGAAAIGDGGTLDTSGVAVTIANVEQARIDNVQITSAGAAGFDIQHTASTGTSVTLTNNSTQNVTGDGILATTSGTGAFALVASGNVIDGASDEGIEINLNGTVNEKDVTLTGNTVNNGTNSNALFVSASSGANNVLIDGGNTFSLNNAAADTAGFSVTGGATLNATVTGNTFLNTPASGRPFEVTNNGGTVRLNITSNSATSGGLADAYFLVNTAGAFGAEDEPNLDANNTSGAFNRTGTIDDLPVGTVPTP